MSWRGKIGVESETLVSGAKCSHLYELEEMDVGLNQRHEHFLHSH